MSSVQYICSKKDIVILAFLVVGLIFSAFIEIIGIGFIPIFIMSILDINTVVEKIPLKIDLTYLQSLNREAIALYGSLILLSIFIFKNFIMFLLIFFQCLVFKKLRINIGLNLFKIYLHSNYLFHVKNNPAFLYRNVEREVSQTVSCIQSAMNLIRESIVLVFIFFLLIFTEPMITLSVFTVLSFL